MDSVILNIVIIIALYVVILVSIVDKLTSENHNKNLDIGMAYVLLFCLVVLSVLIIATILKLY